MMQLFSTSKTLNPLGLKVTSFIYPRPALSTTSCRYASTCQLTCRSSPLRVYGPSNYLVPFHISHVLIHWRQPMRVTTWWHTIWKLSLWGNSIHGLQVAPCRITISTYVHILLLIKWEFDTIVQLYHISIYLFLYFIW